MAITISCIIPALNEQKNIDGLISSILSQNLAPPLSLNEIIVVDNGSQDNTVNIAKNMGAKTYVKPGLTIGGLRNFGAEKAKGDILIFLDADNVLDNSVINNIVKNLLVDNIGAIGVPLRPYGDPTWVEKTWYYHIHTYKKGLNKAGAIASGAFGIKKKLFLEAGGFDERLAVGEDTELSRRLKNMGYQIYLDPECVIHNKGFPKTLLEFLKVEIWHGDSIKSIMTHKKIDMLSIYFIFCFVSVVFAFFAVIGLLPHYLIYFTLFLIVGPALIKSLKRKRKIDLQFVQLSIIYIFYILGRTISILKL
jgi:glycosyltransferase involved in cell wall biosynthesis